MKVLFVCTGNSCRSVMAEGLFRKMLKDMSVANVKAESAGTSTIPGLKPSLETERVMAETGADVSKHRTRLLDRATCESAKGSDVFNVMVASTSPAAAFTLD